ncbi:MAG TPA: PIN domain-containing protein [Pirellulales bacterium]|jgi:tRNA(fMet)-specific endonuclease VapC|nr:PIN domain-containing protein [Pirellulales bacterium]
MDRCLLDTSTLSDVIDLPSKRLVQVAKWSKSYLRAQGHFVFSDVSCYEILRGLRKKQAHIQEQRFQVFCGHCERLPVTAEVFDRAATLWAQGQRQGINVDDADLIIAATALIQRLAVATANPRHFEWIDGLSLSNWRDP